MRVNITNASVEITIAYFRATPVFRLPIIHFKYIFKIWLI